MGKKNNSYTAPYKLKVISFAEQFGNRAAQKKREFWNPTCIIGGNKELLKTQKVTVGYFIVQKLENPYILRTLIFLAAKLEKKVRKLCK
jgi:hypothetical protein